MKLEGTTAVVVGGSRGLGRGAVEALVGRGANVIVVGRDAHALRALTNGQSRVTTIQGDATDEQLAEAVLSEHVPDLVVLCAGAHPVLGSLHELSWDEFQTNWNVDAKLSFVWAQRRCGSR